MGELWGRKEGYAGAEEEVKSKRCRREKKEDEENGEKREGCENDFLKQSKKVHSR